MSERFTGWLIAGRWPLLLLALVLAAACYPAARSLDFDRSVENMFAPDDPLLPSYRALKRTFGGNEIVLVVFRDAELMSVRRQGMRRLTAITAELARTPGVHGVLSLSELDTSLTKMAAGASLLGLSQVPPQGIVDPESDLAVRFRQLFQGYTHGADGVTAAVVCMLEPESQSPVPRRETIERCGPRRPACPADRSRASR